MVNGYFSFFQLSLQRSSKCGICISIHPFLTIYLTRFIFKNLNKLCVHIHTGHLFSHFTTFHLRGLINAIFPYVPRSVISRHIQCNISKYVERLYLDFSFTYMLYSIHTYKFEQMWYQMYQADYCLKLVILYYGYIIHNCFFYIFEKEKTIIKYSTLYPFPSRRYSAKNLQGHFRQDCLALKITRQDCPAWNTFLPVTYLLLLKQIHREATKKCSFLSGLSTKRGGGGKGLSMST